VLIFTVSPMAFANTTLADDAAEKRAVGKISSGL